MPTFSTTTDLLPHQVDAVAKLLPPRVGALFAEMGTGKSRILLELAKLRQAKFDRLFWFCLVSLKATVRREISRHTDLPDAAVCVFDDRVDDASVPRDATVYVIGIESMSSSSRVVLAYRSLVTEASFVAVDESAYIKGNRAARSQRITHMSAHCRYRAVLTGTPITQGVTDLYSQMLFLSPRILGYRSWYSFAANHVEYKERKVEGTRRKVRTGQIVRTHNHEYLAAKIAPYAYQITKTECMTLPGKLFEQRYCTMTAEQRAAYAEAKEEFLLAPVEDWSPIAIFRLYTALMGIVCGYVIRAGERVSLPHDRVDLLLSVLGSIPDAEPVIVWATRHHCVDEIVPALAGRPVASFTGRLSEREREAELTRWRREGGYLVATQAAGGHGLTLNEAAYAVFYNDGFKYSDRVQAEDRNHRIGQGRQPTYVSIACDDSIDLRIQQALAAKANALASFRREVEDCRKQGLKTRAVELVRAL